MGALHPKLLHHKNRRLQHAALRVKAATHSNSRMLLRATQRALRRGARQKSTVVMMRHGESTWNLENKFTGEDRGAERKRSSSPAYRI